MLPKGLAYKGQAQPVADLKFLTDITFINRKGKRQSKQEIFNEVFSIISGARQFILLDMFLYNPFLGSNTKVYRALSQELTDALLVAKKNHPAIQIFVITDPINTVYGGVVSAQFEQLKAAGIELVETDLEALPDSNLGYSFLWRKLSPFLSVGEGGYLQNPFGDGRVPLRSYLAMFNFKANHRKVMVADQGNKWVGLVTSGNPHDASSAHHNQAISFTGAAVVDLLKSEKAVLALSAKNQLLQQILDTFIGQQSKQKKRIDNSTTLQIVTEKSIKEAVLKKLDQCRGNDSIALIMFYLSDREIIDALRRAHQRGALIKLLLDPNKDAFGYPKNGIPNRQVAWELHQCGIAIRWCDTHEEQCHTKLMYIDNITQKQTTIIAGSANFTRRNLDNFNLETDVIVTGTDTSLFFRQVKKYFNTMWNNTSGMGISVDYYQYAENSVFKRSAYRMMEVTGLSTF